MSAKQVSVNGQRWIRNGDVLDNLLDRPVDSGTFGQLLTGREWIGCTGWRGRWCGGGGTGSGCGGGGKGS